MTGWIELTSKDGSMKWLLQVTNIAFIRRKSEDGDAAIFLVSGGTLEPSETYSEVCAKITGGGLTS